MDKIAKAIKKLNSQEQYQIKKILIQINNFNFKGLNILKLKGYENIYRVRKGRLRIIFRIDENKEIYLLAIERRNEKTYNL